MSGFTPAVAQQPLGDALSDVQEMDFHSLAGTNLIETFGVLPSKMLLCIERSAAWHRRMCFE